MSALLEVAASEWSDDWHERAAMALTEVLSGGAKGRYDSQARKLIDVRAPKIVGDGVPFAALIHPENPTSGPYAGMSFVLFPADEAGPCLISLVVGTLGLGPDSQVLGRPGHARRGLALTRWLNERFGRGDQIAWAKSNPTSIEQGIPDVVRRQFPRHARSLERYGNVIYALCAPPAGSEEAATSALWAFLDLAMEERGARHLKAYEKGAAALKGEYLSHLMPNLSESEVAKLLETRRYAVVEGPPGTGKTRLADNLRQSQYQGRGMTVQFHPGTTYESFVGGLSPDPDAGAMGLRFVPRAGHLMTAIDQALTCHPKPYLLHLDEINRADLAKVLGEAIYLLEPQAESPRTVQLSHRFPRRDGVPSDQLTVPENLHILGTMNSADRSIAILDVAIRRRFGFLKLWPQRRVVEAHGDALTLSAFDRLADMFIDWASVDTFPLMPGHSYFLVGPNGDAVGTLKQSLVPLLEEYLAQGYVPGFAEHIRAYVQWIESL
jgi:5-methylcytosine-specific restriction enzyme B